MAIQDLQYPLNPPAPLAAATDTQSRRAEELKERFYYHAASAGCPKDQASNFFKAGTYLHPKQLQFAAAARECDRPDGPLEVGFGGARGGGKLSPLTSLVCTPKGFVRMGNLKIGDSITDPTTGGTTKVIAIHPHDKMPIWKFTFDDGASLEVGADHLWAYRLANHLKPGSKRSSQRDYAKEELGSKFESAKWNRNRVGSTKDIIALFQTGKGIRFPLTEPVAFTKTWHPRTAVSAYMIGLFLGDGHLNSATITNIDKDILEVLSKAGFIKVKSSISWIAQGAFRRSVRDFFDKNDLLKCRSWEKFIPDGIKHGDIETRLEVLRGLLDTDGTVDMRGRVYFISTSKKLAEDVQWIVRSLGGKCRLRNRQTHFTHKGIKKAGRPSFQLRIWHPKQSALFKCERKKRRCLDKWNGGHDLSRELVKVEYVGKKAARCITVSSPYGLYIADNFIVTHNSHVVLAQMGADDCQRRPGLKCLLLRKIGKSNIEHFEELRLRVFGRLPHTFNKKGFLQFANGSKIVAGHFQNDTDIDAYLGLEYDVIAIEEATTLTSKKHKEISTCCRTSKSDWRPRIYSNANPGGVGHTYYKTKFILPYQAKRERDTRFIPSRVTDNPFNNPDYIRVLDALLGWQLRAWRDGDWDIAAGQYFTNFRLDVHVPEWMARFDERKILKWAAGLDYGFTHYTACYLAGYDADDNCYVLDEHAERMWLPETHAPAIKAMFARHGKDEEGNGLLPGRVGSILAGNDVFASESDGKSVEDSYRENGLQLKCANMDRVNGWAEILKRLGDVQRNIKPKLFIHPRCKRLIECLPSLQHDPDKPEDVLKVDVDEDGIGGDDPADALRYLISKKIHKIEQRRLGGTHTATR